MSGCSVCTGLTFSAALEAAGSSQRGSSSQRGGSGELGAGRGKCERLDSVMRGDRDMRKRKAVSLMPSPLLTELLRRRRRPP